MSTTKTYTETYSGMECRNPSQTHTQPTQQVYQQMQYQRSSAKLRKVNSYLYEHNAVSDISKYFYFDLTAIQTARSHLANTVKTHTAVKVRETIMPEQFYARCFKTSHFAMMSTLVGCVLGHSVLPFMSLLVWLTSINYWWRPTVGLARSVDMLIVQGALWTHLYHSQYMTDNTFIGLYYLTMCSAIACYFKAMQHGSIGDFDNDTKFHCSMHFLGNVSNCVLYAGLYFAA